MAGNNGGPWGGGSKGNGDGGDRRPPQGRRPGQDGQVPDIDQIVRKGREQLKVLMGGRGDNGGGGGSGGGPSLPGRSVWILGGLVVLGIWVASSLYRVDTDAQGVELFLGDYHRTTDSGLRFAPWPVVTAEVVPTTIERSEVIGVNNRNQGGQNATDIGLMLTTDENIVDIDFEVVWTVLDPAEFLFNLAEPQETVAAVSQSVMREIVSQNELAPIINVLRQEISAEARSRIQAVLDSYDSGINVVRVNLNGAEPPSEVIDAFRDVQAAEQERERLIRQADAYANRILAGARGQAAQLLEEAEGYRAQQVNEARGEASRFTAVLGEYRQAPEVTRKRLYLETMENVLGRVDKIILDDQSGGGQGVVPYLPLNELNRGGSVQSSGQQQNQQTQSVAPATQTPQTVGLPQ